MVRSVRNKVCRSQRVKQKYLLQTHVSKFFITLFGNIINGFFSVLFVKKQHPSNDQHFHHIAHKDKYFFKVFHPQFFSGHSIEKKVRIIARITLGRCVPNGILILSPVFFPGRDFMQRMLLRSRPLHNSVSTKWAEYSDTAARFLHLSNTRWRSRYQCEILRAARKYKLPRRMFPFLFLLALFQCPTLYAVGDEHPFHFYKLRLYRVRKLKIHQPLSLEYRMRCVDRATNIY